MEESDSPATQSEGQNYSKKYPGLPALDRSHLLVIKPETRKQILAATMATVERDLWKEHLAAIDQRILDITTVPTSFQRQHSYGQVVEQPVLFTMLTQAALIRRVTPEKLSRIAAKEGLKPFLKWMFSYGEAMESFLSSVKKEDDTVAAFAIWARLWENDPEHRNRYCNLAVACALIFDNSDSSSSRSDSSESGPEEIYADFRDADLAGKLETDLETLPAWDLVWVVDLQISPAEVEWARKHIGLSRRNWDRAHKMIEYKMEKAVNDAGLYDQYTLEEILERGGTCEDQAYFGAMTAKANGIPSMKIVGHAERGGHAWFGYKETDKEWNIEAGRYTSDNYVAGTVKERQTGQVLTEHQLKLMTDPQKRTTHLRGSVLLFHHFTISALAGTLISRSPH